MQKASIILLFIWIKISAFSADYYVKNGGNDDANGLTDATAWATISKVNSMTFGAGDNIYFKRGSTWRRESLIVDSGTSAGDVRYGAYGTGSKPRILGSVDLSSYAGWTDQGGNIWQCSNAALSAQPGNLIFNNESSCGFREFYYVNVNSQGDWYYDNVNKRIRLYSTSNPGTHYSHIECALYLGTWGWFVPIIDKDYVTLSNLDIRYCGMSAINGTGSSHITVQDCEQSFNGGAYESYTTGVRLGGSIGSWNSNSYWLVERCRISNEYDCGLTIQGSGNGLVIDHMVFRDNIIDKVEYGFELFLNGTDYSTTMSNVEIQNNVFSNCGEGWAHNQRWSLEGDGPAGYCWLSSNLMATISNFYIRNNIIKDATESLVRIRDTYKARNIVWDYNLYYQESTGYIGSLDYTNNYSTFAAYRTALGKETHGKYGNPLFVGQADFHLSSTLSAAYHAGLDVGYTADYDLVAWDDLTPSDGAYELAEGGPEPPAPSVITHFRRKGGRYLMKYGKRIRL